MSTSQATRVQLQLSDTADARGLAATWIGRLVALGTRAARYSRTTSNRQVVIALSVPKRDFAAALIGCGWVLASEAPLLPEPLEVLREMSAGQALRAVNSSQVITGKFLSLDEQAKRPRARFAGSAWMVDSIRALAPINDFDESARAPRPEPGSVEQMAQLDRAWDARLVSPAADLAIVGTLTWLNEDFEAHLARENDQLPSSRMGSVLMPKAERSATWFTRVYAANRFADQLPIPKDLNAVLLDGSGAIKYLAEIEVPVVICIVDRSVADETAAELVIQLRNTRGEPLSLSGDLGWSPPAGVEALAFTVPL